MVQKIIHKNGGLHSETWFDQSWARENFLPHATTTTQQQNRAYKGPEKIDKYLGLGV